MCGRFTMTVVPEFLLGHFEIETIPIVMEPRYNVAPTQVIPAVRIPAPGAARELAPLRWGLVSAWAKDPSIGNKMINARAEEAAGKPAFRAAYAARRCIIPADGFYEWRREGSKRQPFYFRLRDGGLFGMAGLWERWRNPGDPGGAPLEPWPLLTVRAHELVAGVHDRMPAILPPADYAAWLDPENRDAAALRELTRPFPAEAMTRHAVDTRVNRPSEDDPRCIAPLPISEPSFFD